MPLYEYECEKCGRFERIQKFSDQPISRCPECEGEVEKLISSPAIRFKGSGFYITDYAAKSEPAEKSEGAKSGDKASKTKGEGTTKSGSDGATKGKESSGGKTSSASSATKSDGPKSGGPKSS